MNVFQHPNHLDSAKEVPLITESATVTAVEPMDENRKQEVLERMLRVLDEHGSVSWRKIRPSVNDEALNWIKDYMDSYDWGTPLNYYLTESDDEGGVGRVLESLQKRYMRSYPALFRISVDTDDEIEFVPGQYIALRYGGVSRVYSVASPPSREDVEFCVRRVKGGRLTEELADSLEVGDEVTLRGPYGEFVLEPPSSNELVFLATGTGVAPFKSMIDYCLNSGYDRFGDGHRDIWLFLGAGWEDDLPYREHFWELHNNHGHFYFVPTLSREGYLTDWGGETAYVQHVLMKYFERNVLSDIDFSAEFERFRDEEPRYDIEERLHPDEMEVYACGINAMVYGLVEAVETMGVPDKHIHFEGYG